MNDEQRKFVYKNNLTESMFFDGNGKSGRKVQLSAKSLGYAFIKNGAPCKAANHTLRTRKGHCIQCDTAKITYMLRSLKNGTVYIAHSKSMNAIKIGSTTVKTALRIDQLNNESYGGVCDWTLLRAQKFAQAGKAEFSLHNLFKQNKEHSKTTFKEGRNQKCSEIFNVSAIVASQSMININCD